MGCNCKSKTVSTQPIKQVTKPTTTTNSPAKRVFFILLVITNFTTKFTLVFFCHTIHSRI